MLGGGLTLKQLVTLLSSLNREDEEVLLVGEDRRGEGGRRGLKEQGAAGGV